MIEKQCVFCLLYVDNKKGVFFDSSEIDHKNGEFYCNKCAKELKLFEA